MMRPILVWLIMALVVVKCTGCGPNSDGSKLRESERLQSTIPLFPSMVLVSEHTISKSMVADVSRHYKSDAAYEDVKSFYVDHLTRMGWTVGEEHPLKDWGEDLGGRELMFSKGEFYLAISYAGDRAPWSWNYALTTGWRKK